MTVALVKPSLAHLPDYRAALERGWSPDNVRGAVAAAEELEKIKTDPRAFVEGLDDPAAKGGPVKLPDGSTAPRLPGFRRWIWDDTFCGSIGFRWQPGTPRLPEHVLSVTSDLRLSRGGAIAGAPSRRLRSCCPRHDEAALPTWS